MDQIIIIADDLTGACDSGIKFRNAGFETLVLTDVSEEDVQAAGRCAIVSINTNTRSALPEDARRRVEKLLRVMQKDKERLYYKKVDSVLRGNVADELEACLQQLEPDFALIAPAFPASGRRMKHGRIYPVADQNPDLAIDAEQIVSQTGRRCAQIPLETVARGAGVIMEEAERLYREGAELLLADCWEEADLAEIAKAAHRFGRRCIPVGSAGLAEQLAACMAKENATCGAAALPQLSQNDKILIAIGSRHPAMLEQMQTLKKRCPLDTYLIAVDGLTEENLEARMQALLARLDERRAEDKNDLLLTTESIYADASSEMKLLCENDFNQAILDALGIGAARIAQSEPVRCLIAAGGDAANEILRRLRLNRIELLLEPSPGIVVGRASGSDGRTLLLATKSGGFGKPETLLELYRYFTARKQAGLKGEVV